MPTRPCSPTLPKKFLGPSLNLDLAVSNTPVAWNTLKAVNGTAYLEVGSDNMPSDLYHTRQGYLLPSSDMLLGNIDYVSHLFGRLGQGKNTSPYYKQPFYWGAEKATNLASMLFSIFPADETDSGLGNTNSLIRVEARAQKWTPYSDLKAPVYPMSPPSNPYELNYGLVLNAVLSLSAAGIMLQ